MNILLLGATGRVGGYVIDYALAAKHQVLAVVRNPAKIQRMDVGLTVAEGNLSNLQSVLEKGLLPIDMVINVIGGNVLKPSTVVTESVQAALAAVASLLGRLPLMEKYTSKTDWEQYRRVKIQ